MPTYDYKCGACDHQFELFQSITAPAVRKCPKCKKLKVKRLIGIGAGIIFKGSGFYQTDYRSESYKQGAEKDKPAASPAAKTDSAAPAKPAASGGKSSGSSDSSSKGDSSAKAAG